MKPMIGNDLLFAHGTPQRGSSAEEVEKMVIGLFSPPTDLLSAYQMGRHKFGTGDLVLVVAAHDPEIISAWPRQKYIESALSRCAPGQLPRLAHESAHKVAKLPGDSVAFWLVLEVKQLPVPVMTVLYTTPYEVSAAATN